MSHYLRTGRPSARRPAIIDFHSSDQVPTPPTTPTTPLSPQPPTSAPSLTGRYDDDDARPPTYFLPVQFQPHCSEANPLEPPVFFLVPLPLSTESSLFLPSATYHHASLITACLLPNLSQAKPVHSRIIISLLPLPLRSPQRTLTFPFFHTRPLRSSPLFLHSSLITNHPPPSDNVKSPFQNKLRKIRKGPFVPYPIVLSVLSPSCPPRKPIHSTRDSITNLQTSPAALGLSTIEIDSLRKPTNHPDCPRVYLQHARHHWFPASPTWSAELDQLFALRFDLSLH